MPFFDDTTGQVPTTYLVEVDAKAEAWERISIPRGNVVIPEGAVFVRDDRRRAAEPAAVDGVSLLDDPFIYINYANPLAPQTNDRQTFNVAGQGIRYSVDLDGGNYVGIMGPSLRITMPYDARFFVTADIGLFVQGDPITLKRETAGAAERPGAIKFGRPTGGDNADGRATLLAAPTAGAAAQSALSFATVESFSPNNQKITFIFTNSGKRVV